MVDKYVKQSWIGQQEWKNIFFVHWPIPYETLRPHIPDCFTLESFNGKAWISLVLFEAVNTRLRWMPNFLSYPSFLQANVRTYVMYNNEPGIYFLSIDANRTLAVFGARLLSLPYNKAEIKIMKNDNEVFFVSNRHNQFGNISAQFQTFPTLISTKKDATAYWLTERYHLWFIKGNKIIKNTISHSPWELQEAKLDIQMEGIIPFLFDIHSPIVHYATYKKSHLFPLEKKGIISN